VRERGWVRSTGTTGSFRRRLIGITCEVDRYTFIWEKSSGGVLANLFLFFLLDKWRGCSMDPSVVLVLWDNMVMEFMPPFLFCSKMGNFGHS